MQVVTVKTPGLAHLSYVLVDGGHAAVIDPRLDLDAYLDVLNEHGARLTHIFETHRNEDLVSGAHALHQRTGARVLHGTALPFAYGEGADDGSRYEVGSCVLEVRHTPGHTDESISIAVTHRDTGDSPIGVFTGDALFVGDVGRTDFYPDRAEEVAGLLYDSIHERLLPLGDQALLWPAHGAGSVCGDGMADRDFSTLGYERAHNPMLQLDRDAFIAHKLDEHHTRPPYFRRMEKLNKDGHSGLGHLPHLRLVGPDALPGTLLDVRAATAWAGSHADGSLCIPAAMIPSWAGWWLPYDEPISLIGDDTAQLDEALHHLVRIGYMDVRHALRGGITAWQTAGERIGTTGGMSATQLHERLDDVVVIDVRKPKEFASGHVPGAKHVPLNDLTEAADRLDRDAHVVTFCGSGQRATIAASILERRGFSTVSICWGSMAAWKAADLPVEKP